MALERLIDQSGSHQPPQQGCRRQLNTDHGAAGRVLVNVATWTVVEASSVPKSSAGAWSLRMSLGRLLSSFSTARRCCAEWVLRSVPLGEVVTQEPIGVFIRSALPG